MWALMGASTFLGLKFGVWEDNADVGAVAEAAADLMINGLAPRAEQWRRDLKTSAPVGEGNAWVSTWSTSPRSGRR